MSIVALHGFTGSPENFEALGCKALCVAGHGHEAVLEAGRSFVDEVDRLATQLPAASHLLGYSLGARLALALAIRHPARVSSLCLIGGQPGLEDPDARAQRLREDSLWVELLRRQGIAAFVDAWEALPMWRSQEALPSQVLERQRKTRLAHEPEQLARALESLGTGAMPPQWDALAGLKLPVQLVVGGLDAKYLAIAKEMRARLPDAELQVLADCGHNPILEAPLAIRELLDSRSS